MADFGYTLSEDRQINFDANNHNPAQYVKRLEPSFDICISCGTCTATCTAGQFTDFNPRNIIILLKRGELDHLEAEIKKCMLCGKCYLVCPRGVNTRNLIISLRKVLDKNSIYGSL